MIAGIEGKSERVVGKTKGCAEIFSFRGRGLVIYMKKFTRSEWKNAR